MKILLIILGLMFLKSCQSVPSAEIEEYFSDSTNIGKKGLNKIEITQYKSKDSSWVEIKFYSKKSDKWAVKNEFSFRKDSILGIDPEILDFNNDGNNDFIYRSAVAARGGNTIKTLFIYSPEKDELIYIKNSEDYPNLSYHKHLNCIQSFILTGSVDTAFLRIKKDSLYKFANIHISDSIIVSEYDKQGNKQILLKKKFEGENPYIGFKNYNPLEELEEQN